MIVSPASLSWTCLFEGTVGFDCPASPSCFRGALEKQEGNAAKVFVAWNLAAGEWPALEPYEGLAVINARKLDVRKFAAEGFSYARHFAVVPSLARPRFFIPLDNPRVAAGALGLYPPVRRISRIPWSIARLAARGGLKIWYRDHVWIARRSVPRIEQLLGECFGHGQFRMAISTGNAETVKNRKLGFGIVDEHGTARGFAKLSLSPLSRERIHHEAAVLESLSRRSNPVSASRRLLLAEVDDAALIVTSPVAGSIPRTRITAAHREFLASLQFGPHKPVLQTDLVQCLLDRTRSSSGNDGSYHSALLDLLPELEAIVLPSSTMHGDFTPWNLRIRGTEICAFDWEYGAFDSPPLLDEIHHMLAVTYFVDRGTPDQACSRFRRFARSGAMGLPPDQILALGILYLIDHLTMLRDEGYGDDYPKVRWWRQVYEQLGADRATARSRATAGPIPTFALK